MDDFVILCIGAVGVVLILIEFTLCDFDLESLLYEVEEDYE